MSWLLSCFHSRRWLVATLLLGWWALLAGPAAAQSSAPARPPTDSIAWLLKEAYRQVGSDVPRANQLARRALRLARRSGDPRRLSACLNLLGVIEPFAGNDLLAQQYLEQALVLAQRTHWQEGQAQAYMGLGFVAYDENNFRQALRYYQQAEQRYAALPPGSIPDSLRMAQRLRMRINISSAYIELNQPDSAGRICREALALPGAARHPRQYNGLLQNLGDVQLKLHRPDLARRSLAQGLRLAADAYDSAGLLSRLAEANLALRQPLAARQQATQALALACRSGVVEARSDALETLASALYALRRPEAFDTLKSYLALHDTLLAADRATAITQAQARFHAREQQTRIRELEQGRQLAAQGRELAQLRARQQLTLGVLLLVLLLVSAGVLLWRYRRRQAQAAAALRHQLAADLHDDVGTLLSQISLQSGVLQAGLADAAGQQQQLGQIAQASQLAVRQLNDVVWSLDAHNDTLPNLLDRLRDYACEVLVPVGLAVDFDLPDSLPAQVLPTEVCRHLYLIYKEALHNVVKHASTATRVYVGLSCQLLPPALCLRVVNDAPHADGAAHAASAATGRRSGHGLRNMAARAAALGGTARSGPEPDGGFGVRVQLPLSE